MPGRLLIAAGSLALLACVTVAFAAQRDWTGTAACGRCHPAQLAAWQQTRHAQTRDRFSTVELTTRVPASGAQPPGRCLACHATGEAPAGPAIAIEVGCEACHGAGAAYAEEDVMRNLPVARALGLVDLGTPGARAAVCMQCHARPTAGRPVDFNAPVHPVTR